MCLVYDHKKTLAIRAADGELTLYKVYHAGVVTRSLMSPFKSDRIGGHLRGAGDVDAYLSHAFFDFLSNYAYEWDGEPPASADGRTIDVSGLHCLATFADAQKFLNALIDEWGRNKATYRIVQVTAKASDVLLAGGTPTDSTTVDTVVVRRFRISSAEFEKAFEPCA